MSNATLVTFTAVVTHPRLGGRFCGICWSVLNICWNKFKKPFDPQINNTKIQKKENTKANKHAGAQAYSNNLSSTCASIIAGSLQFVFVGIVIVNTVRPKKMIPPLVSISERCILLPVHSIECKYAKTENAPSAPSVCREWTTHMHGECKRNKKTR